jgi:hypothetical protein
MIVFSTSYSIEIKYSLTRQSNIGASLSRCLISANMERRLSGGCAHN